MSDERERRAHAHPEAGLRQKILLVMPRLEAKPLYDHFTRLDYGVKQSASALYALTMLEYNPPDVLVCQYNTEDLTSLELAEILNEDPGMRRVALLLLHPPENDIHSLKPPGYEHPRTVFLPSGSPLMEISQAVTRLLRAPATIDFLEAPLPSTLSSVPKRPLSSPQLTGPVQPDELARAASEVATAEDVGEISRFDVSRAQVRGSFQSTSLFGLLNTLTTNQKTGRLCVRAEHADALIQLSQGTISHCLYARSYAEQGLEAIVHHTLGSSTLPFYFGNVQPMTNDRARFAVLWQRAAVQKRRDTLLHDIAFRLSHQS